ncbi:hypothetical protein AS144_07585 [Francisella endosymbiont of Amblyomma maculatum]|nr:hypothetical protein AS144_07585 [Francisella endosymbiont of Amblyomma maculatum]
MTSRYTTLFENLANKNQGDFISFVTIGDPNKKLSFEIIETLIQSGADALELGIPFSGPLADGPTIQEANIRALDRAVLLQMIVVRSSPVIPTVELYRAQEKYC